MPDTTYLNGQNAAFDALARLSGWMKAKKSASGETLSCHPVTGLQHRLYRKHYVIALSTSPTPRAA